MDHTSDLSILRDLVKDYLDFALDPIQDERRNLWRAHHSLKPTRPPVLIIYGMWNRWCRKTFGDANMRCQDPFYREYERTLRIALFHREVGDDYVAQPWLTLGASKPVAGSGFSGLWGVSETRDTTGMDGGAFKSRPPLQTWDDVQKLVAPEHVVDEEATARNLARLQDAVGDLIEIDVSRCPLLTGFSGDISTSLSALRGLEQLMLDMHDSPRELHNLLAFMRDGILRNQQQAEEAGHFSLTCSHNQAMPFAEELEDPKANSGPHSRKDLWGFFAAQEYTLISPRFHDEFLYQYQLPLMANFGLTHYGCCEDLTKKIDMLRQAPSLRSIAVTPVANLGECAEQIGTDYAISWRPNPTDMVCGEFNEEKVRRIIGEGLQSARGCRLHVFLKDVETVEGEPERLRRWTEIVRSVADSVWE
ncbi:MAG: hypothetical protein ABFE07_15220 [Armatimonadia bacterium]